MQPAEMAQYARNRLIALFCTSCCMCKHVSIAVYLSAEVVRVHIFIERTYFRMYLPFRRYLPLALEVMLEDKDS